MAHTLYHGDCLEVLKGLADNSIDAICCDPPSSINFMGLHWDNDKGGRDQWIAWLSGIMKECHRVLKPGGHAFVWSLPRTSHWTGMALELAGFEVRDLVSHLYDSSRDVQAFVETLSPEQRQLLEIILANSDDTFTSALHVFGCLSEDTEILTSEGWEHYHIDVASKLVLCYNIDNDTFEFNKPTRSFVYENQYPAYRIQSDFTDQIVSRNHRVIVERGGKKDILFCRIP